MDERWGRWRDSPTEQGRSIPALPGDVVVVPYGDADALAEAVDASTAAVFLEPIQGEGGVIVPATITSRTHVGSPTMSVRCFVDEVQTGIGRTGTGLPSGVWSES